jgi:hypothetical protein
MNETSNFYKQPNWLYMYMSHVADINANSNHINGSSFYFDTNCHYPNWYVIKNTSTIRGADVIPPPL